MCIALDTSHPLFLPDNVVFCLPDSESSIFFPIKPIADCIDISVSGLCEDTADCLYKLRNVSILQHSLWQGRQPNAQIINMFSEKLSELQAKLLTWHNDIAHGNVLLKHDPVSRSCRLAALIYWRALSRLSQLTSLTSMSYAKSLKIALSETNLLKSWSSIPETLLWVCLVGAAAAGPHLRGWFVARLGPVMMALGIKDFSSCQASMLHFGWLVRMSKSSLQKS